MKLLSLIKDAFSYMRGTNVASQDVVDLHDLLSASIEVGINYLGGPLAAIQICGRSDGDVWQEFKKKHDSDLIMKVTNTKLYPYPSRLADIGYCFHISSLKLSKADLKFINNMALSRMTEDTNFKDNVDGILLTPTPCKYIFKLSITSLTLYRIVCK